MIIYDIGLHWPCSSAEYEQGSTLYSLSWLSLPREYPAQHADSMINCAFPTYSVHVVEPDTAQTTPRHGCKAHAVTVTAQTLTKTCHNSGHQHVMGSQTAA